jgi:hypothetical protein
METIVSRVRSIFLIAHTHARSIFLGANLQVQFTSFAQPQGKCLLLFKGLVSEPGTV